MKYFMMTMGFVFIIGFGSEAMSAGLTKYDRQELGKGVRELQEYLPIPLDQDSDLTSIRLIGDTMYYTATIKGNEEYLMNRLVELATAENPSASEEIAEYVIANKQEMMDILINEIQTSTANRICTIPSAKWGMSKGMKVTFIYEYLNGIRITGFKLDSKVCSMINK
jgi:hypothetical protein